MPPLVRGLLYGGAVWTASYLGVIPALGLLSPATRHPPRRTAIVLGGNLLWGVTTALIVDAFEGKPDSERTVE